MKILITGGTVFVSRYIAEYYAQKGHDVYVLNRNTRPQPPDTTLIQADRHDLGDILRPYRFDLVIDTAYTARDVDMLLDALGEVGDYILISSGAVYPETAPLPFTEDTELKVNRYWDRYGTDKIEAEAVLLRRVVYPAPAVYLWAHEQRVPGGLRIRLREPWQEVLSAGGRLPALAVLPYPGPLPVHGGAPLKAPRAAYLQRGQ